MNVMHEKPSAPTILQRDPMKLRSWKTLLFEVFFFFMISLCLDLSLWLSFWKSSCLITLEIKSLVLNLGLLSSKPRLTKSWFHNKVLFLINQGVMENMKGIDSLDVCCLIYLSSEGTFSNNSRGDGNTRRYL